MELLSNATQLITVHVPDWSQPQAEMQWLYRDSVHDAWQPASASFEVAIGKNGLAYGQSLAPMPDDAVLFKKEGDMKTPAGLFGLCFAFGYEAMHDPQIKWPYLPVDENFVGIDDPASRYYNCIVNQARLATKDWQSAETMLRPDGLYKWGMVIDYNFSPCVPGAGSLIFMHIWRGQGQGTEGCIAMPEGKMVELLHWIDGSKNTLLWIGKDNGQ